jgi:hypothetical protein
MTLCEGFRMFLDGTRLTQRSWATSYGGPREVRSRLCATSAESPRPPPTAECLPGQPLLLASRRIMSSHAPRAPAGTRLFPKEEGKDNDNFLAVLGARPAVNRGVAMTVNESKASRRALAFIGEAMPHYHRNSHDHLEQWAGGQHAPRGHARIQRVPTKCIL